MKLFSRRNEVPEDVYSYEIPERVRNRLLLTLKTCADQSGHCSMDSILEESEELLHRAYGELRTRPHWVNQGPRQRIIDHLFECDDEEIMDFFQVCFQCRGYAGGQRTVNELNKVLEEENIGYEISDFQQEKLSGGSFRTIPPTILKKDEKTLHHEVVHPCLHVLSDDRFRNARQELLKAFDEYRNVDYPDSITDAGSAFETVLKTICTHKKWRYSPTDTCSALLEVCRAKGLFHPFYRTVLEGTATIRNKIGDAHGKGPKPEFTATKELAEHMLYTVCNNINLLITLARL